MIARRTSRLLLIAGIALASLTTAAAADTADPAPVVERMLVQAAPAVQAVAATDTVAVVAAILAGIALVITGLHAVLAVIAPRTKTTIDDSLRDNLAALLAMMRGLPGVPPAVDGTARFAPPPPRDPQAGRALPLVMALLAVGLGGLTLACSSWQQVRADAVAVEHGAVACAKADVPAITALGYKLGIEVAASVFTGHGIPWPQLEAEAEAGAKAQGIAVGSCAFGQLIADLAKLLPVPNTPTVMARADDGRGELELLKAHLGVTEINLASGETL